MIESILLDLGMMESHPWSFGRLSSRVCPVGPKNMAGSDFDPGKQGDDLNMCSLQAFQKLRPVGPKMCMMIDRRSPMTLTYLDCLQNMNRTVSHRFTI